MARRKISKIVKSEETLRAKQFLDLLDDYTKDLERINSDIDKVVDGLIQNMDKATPEQKATLLAITGKQLQQNKEFQDKLKELDNGRVRF